MAKKLLYFLTALTSATPALAADAGNANITAIILICIALLAICLLGLASFAIWLWMLIDCVTRDFETKTKWLLLLALVPFAQFFYYFMIKRKPGKKLDMNKVDSLAMAAFITGLCAYIMCLYFGFMLGIPAIILAVLSFKKLEENKTKGRDLANSGLILGITGIAMQILFFIAYFAFIIAIMMASIMVGNQVESTYNITSGYSSQVHEPYPGQLYTGADSNPTTPIAYSALEQFQAI